MNLKKGREGRGVPSGFTTSRRMPVYTVKIALDDDHVGRDSRLGQVKLGMTGTAEIVTDREGILLLLVRSIRQSVSLG